MSGFDPNRDKGIGPTGKSDVGLPLSTYLVGPVEVVYGGDPSKTPFPIRYEIDYLRVYQSSPHAPREAEPR